MSIKYGLPGAFCILLAVSSTAQADDFPYAKSGFYLGGETGASEFKSGCRDLSVTCEDDDEVYGGFAGYRFNDYFAIESGYHELGEATSWNIDGKKSEISIEGYDLSVLVGMPLSDRWMAYVRGGGLYYDANLIDGGDLFPEQANNAKGWTETAGAGLVFRATDHLQTRLQYQYVNDFGGSDWGRQPDVQAVTLGVLWQFGNVASKPTREPIAEPVNTPAPTPAPAPVEPETKPVHVLSQFDFDSSEVSNTGALNQLIKELGSSQAAITITGYADGEGTAEYNMELSKERAEAVKAYLVSKGVSASRITLDWKGETEASSQSPNRADRKAVVSTELPK